MEYSMLFWLSTNLTLWRRAGVPSLIAIAIAKNHSRKNGIRQQIYVKNVI